MRGKTRNGKCPPSIECYLIYLKMHKLGFFFIRVRILISSRKITAGVRNNIFLRFIIILS